jgi:hypothetical protein
MNTTRSFFMRAPSYSLSMAAGRRVRRPASVLKLSEP